MLDEQDSTETEDSPPMFEREITPLDSDGDILFVQINQLAAQAIFEMSAAPEARKTDLDILREVWIEDAYKLDPRVLVDAVVIDFGAHMGAFAIRAACQGAKVFAFECDKHSVARIEKNVELTNTWLKQDLDVSTYVGTIAPTDKSFIGIHRNADGMSTALVDNDVFLHNDVDMDVIPITVDGAIQRVLDNVGFATSLPASDTPPIALLKCDIEGSEYKSFLNCVNLKYVERIEMEVHESKYGQLGTLIEHLLKTHRVYVFGVPERGGMLTAIRY